MLPQSSKPSPGTTVEENFAYFLWQATEKFTRRIQIVDVSEPKTRAESFTFLSHFIKLSSGMFGHVLDMATIQAKYDEFINFEFTSLPEFREADQVSVLTLCDHFIRDRKRLYHNELYSCFNPNGKKNLPYRAAFLLKFPLKASNFIPDDLTHLRNDATLLQKNLDPMAENMLEDILERVKTLNLL